MMKDNPNRSIPLDDLLAKLVEAAALPFEQAHPIERNLWQFSRYLARVCADHR